MKRKTDLVLLHAPSVYDFRKRPTLHGPVSDVVPSTQVFEMYPIGFMTMLAYLRKHGYSARIINVALKMLKSRRFDAERLIASLEPRAFGIDLHWLVHAQGSLELAAVAKRKHSDVPVIFGGLSASYFYEELIRYPQVDFVLRGDSTEEALRRLLAAIKGEGSLGDVPNLVWKDAAGVQVNEMSHVPPDLDALCFDYREIMRSCARHFDIVGHIPFKTWFRYPIVAELTCRGCVHNCVICGGSNAAYRRICGRSQPAYRDPERIARDMAVAARHIAAPIIVLGDIMQAGVEYARTLLTALAEQGMKNHVALEFFAPPPREIFELANRSLANYNIQISPESHDESVRAAFGRPYGNAELERSMSDALECGCKRIDVFFMIGLPKQTAQSARDTIGYCEELMRRFGGGNEQTKVHPYISPLAPFLDPGSIAFEEPEKHGYRLFHSTLEEHRQALLAPSWKHTLNYETEWMSKDELVEVTYEAAAKLNELKLRYGLLDRKEARRIAERTEQERRLIGEIDRVSALADEAAREAKLSDLMAGFQSTGPSTICRKNEMNWPAAVLKFKSFRVLGALLSTYRRSARNAAQSTGDGA